MIRENLVREKHVVPKYFYIIDKFYKAFLSNKKLEQ